MIKLAELLNEFQGKRLAVFDFDDTLAKSEAYIYVTKADGEELKLDPARVCRI
jgi:phosphoserine phosphatase